ncbi:hypothetical protein PR048_004523 [Dryococelus australis]|uniref:Uncharacterized protein n=1 Tax=Dryococelus australis TaxID=614101 RepID=A0ABQ9I5N5_9NEOP|nr:hypothetical protein PR048_004523 [Dryococelus australis]
MMMASAEQCEFLLDRIPANRHQDTYSKATSDLGEQKVRRPATTESWKLTGYKGTGCRTLVTSGGELPLLSAVAVVDEPYPSCKEGAVFAVCRGLLGGERKKEGSTFQGKPPGLGAPLSWSLPGAQTELGEGEKVKGGLKGFWEGWGWKNPLGFWDFGGPRKSAAGREHCSLLLKLCPRSSGWAAAGRSLQDGGQPAPTAVITGPVHFETAAWHWENVLREAIHVVHLHTSEPFNYDVSFYAVRRFIPVKHLQGLSPQGCGKVNNKQSTDQNFLKEQEKPSLKQKQIQNHKSNMNCNPAPTALCSLTLWERAQATQQLERPHLPVPPCSLFQPPYKTTDEPYFCCLPYYKCNNTQCCRISPKGVTQYSQSSTAILRAASAREASRKDQLCAPTLKKSKLASVYPCVSATYCALTGVILTMDCQVVSNGKTAAAGGRRFGTTGLVILVQWCYLGGWIKDGCEPPLSQSYIIATPASLPFPRENVSITAGLTHIELVCVPADGIVSDGAGAVEPLCNVGRSPGLLQRQCEQKWNSFLILQLRRLLRKVDTVLCRHCAECGKDHSGNGLGLSPPWTVTSSATGRPSRRLLQEGVDPGPLAGCTITTFRWLSQLHQVFSCRTLQYGGRVLLVVNLAAGWRTRVVGFSQLWYCSRNKNLQLVCPVDVASYGLFGICSVAIHSLPECVGGEADVFCITLINQIVCCTVVIALDWVCVVSESAVESSLGLVNGAGATARVIAGLGSFGSDSLIGICGRLQLRMNQFVAEVRVTSLDSEPVTDVTHRASMPHSSQLLAPLLDNLLCQASNGHAPEQYKLLTRLQAIEVRLVPSLHLWYHGNHELSYLGLHRVLVVPKTYAFFKTSPLYWGAEDPSPHVSCHSIHRHTYLSLLDDSRSVA